MTVTIYNSTDANAPILTGVPSSMIGVLDACLVNGYPGKTSAGWTKPFTGTNTAAYRAGTGNQRYLRIDDTLASAAIVCGFESMSGINTWTGPFPALVQLSPGTAIQTITFGSVITSATPTGLTAGTTYTATIVIDGTRTFNYSALGSTITTYNTLTSSINSVLTGVGTCSFVNGILFISSNNTAGSNVGVSSVSVTNSGANPLFSSLPSVATIQPATIASPGGYWLKVASIVGLNPVSWTIVATSSAFYMWINTNNETPPYFQSFMCFFGDIVSYRPNDVYNTLLILNGTNANAPNFSALASSITQLSVGHYMPRSFTQIGQAIQVGKHSDMLRGTTNFGRGSLTYPNPVDGSLTLGQVWIHEPSNPSNLVRGILPGAWNICHLLPLTHGDTFSGTGSISSKSFQVFNHYAAGGNVLSQVAIETSNTW